MTMTHPGLAIEWAFLVCLFMLILCIRIFMITNHQSHNISSIELIQLPLIGPIIQNAHKNTYLLITLKLIVLAIFLLIIAAGLFGTPIPERNVATVLTWNYWWAGLIVSIFFIGSAWCAVCPWDTLANWLVQRRFWKRGKYGNSLNLRVPVYMRNVWPALFLLIVLTWLELGMGITTNPYITAILALAIIVMATTSLAVFENKAFCRYFCPVGRTVGFYSQLAPIELRPINYDICANCTTLECYHGTETISPCPTHLVMGRLTQNTYCTSCGNCSQNCPENNIAWRFRPFTKEIAQTARPHWDEAWFMLILLALTCFHGLSMLPVFEFLISRVGQIINDSGQLLISFSVILFISILAPVAFYALLIEITQYLSQHRLTFKKLFISFAFVSLPLAFAYHLAHNLNHLLREGGGLLTLLSNPFGYNTQPLNMMEKHQRHFDLLISQDLLYAFQAGLLVFGFWISLRIIKHRGTSLNLKGLQILPIIFFVISITCFNLWLLMQPMVMRM